MEIILSVHLLMNCQKIIFMDFATKVCLNFFKNVKYYLNYINNDFLKNHSKSPKNGIVQLMKVIAQAFLQISTLMIIMLIFCLIKKIN